MMIVDGPMRDARRGITLSLGAALATACAGGPIESLHPIANIPPFIIRDSAPADSFDLTFLGTSGFLVKRDGHAVMTGPLFSNPGFFWHILFRFPIHQRTGFIDSVFSDTALRHGAEVTASILIGHSHYDHLMDVPYVAEHYALHAQIYGSPTMGHILAGDSLLHHRTWHPDSLDRVRVIDAADVGTVDRSGRWYYVADSTIRFMALRSEHPANFLWITIAKRNETHDLTQLPTGAWGWSLGETYAYLIDLLGTDKHVVFRIYYTDAPGRPPLGFAPTAVLADGHRVDVAILCVGNYDKVDTYPQALLRQLEPRMVVLGHWEDFFRNASKPEKVVWLTSTNPLVARIDSALPPDATWITPRRFATLRVVRVRVP